MMWGIRLSECQGCKLASRLRAAIRFDREAEEVVGRAVIASRASLTQIQRTTIRAWREGRAPTARELETAMAQLVSVVARVQILAYLRGSESALELVRPHLPKELSQRWFDRQITKAEERLGYDVEPVEQYFNTQAAEVVEGLAQQQAELLQADVNQLIAEGANVREGTQALTERLQAYGLSPKTPFQLETIFRTQTRMSYTAGQWDVYQNRAVNEIIWGYEYITVGDDRVREEHAAMAGMKLDKNDRRWMVYWPPNGWNCRCQVVPVFVDDPVSEQVEKPPGQVDGTVATPDDDFRFNPGRVIPVPRNLTAAVAAAV